MESSGGKRGYRLILPSLIKHLRSILDQYPDDGQILKELIQNAEDAGATEIKFLIDENSYPTDKLHHPDMAQFQGPALYAYNNATFEEKDWDGLLMLNDSFKEKDPMKVGRFGLGFKSVLHMTDLPSVLSKNQLLMIDPQEKFLTHEGKYSSAKMWDLQDKKEIGEVPDQFKPYKGLFGSNQHTFDQCYYDGTLFRFPLRQKASKLSSTVYESQRVKDLIHSFEYDANTLLLFLKNLERIEIFYRPKGSVELVPLYKVQLAQVDLQAVQEKRRYFKKQCATRTSLPAEGCTVTYHVTVEVTKYPDGVIPKMSTSSWLVTEHVAGGGVSKQLQQLCNNDKLSLIPLVGVAMETNSAKQGESKTQSDPKGQIFCFLPLPVEEGSATGLPVHVNGFFAISQNRRHLKWPTTAQKKESEESVLWNQCLLRELVPKVYCELLRQAIRMKIYPLDVYNAMPNPRKVQEKWWGVRDETLKAVFQHDVIFTARDGGKWVKVHQALFDCLDEDEATKALISSVMVKCNKNIARVPEHIMKALQKYYGQGVVYINPSTTTSEMKRNPNSYIGYAFTEKLLILKYVLKDRSFHDMIGLELLPCGDGRMVHFQTHGQAVHIPTWETPRCLFPGLEASLLADDLDPEVGKHLLEMANQRSCQLRSMNSSDADMLLQRVLPRDWQGQEVVDTRSTKLDIPVEWFTHLWTYLRITHERDLAPFTRLHILPLGNSFEGKLVTLSSPCVMSSAIGFGICSDQKMLLEKVGVHIVEELPQCVHCHFAVNGNYVKIPQPTELIKLICKCLQMIDEQRRRNLIEKLSTEPKLALLNIIGNLPDGFLSHTQIDILRSLPILPATGQNEGFFVSPQRVSKAADLTKIPFRLSEQMIDISNPIVRKASQVLQIEIMDLSHILRCMVQEISDDKHSKATLTSFVEFIFTKPQKYCKDTNFLQMLSEVKFVTCGMGDLRKPSQLYDPSDMCMQHMFADQNDMFPTGPFAKPERIRYLKMMGLKCLETYSAEDAYKAMKQVHRHFKTDQGTDKASMLLYILNKRPELLDQTILDNTLLSHASGLCWVPVMQSIPTGYPESLRWRGQQSSQVVKPSEVVVPKLAPIVGSVCSIVDGNTDGLAGKFRWSVQPSLTKILDHLDNIVKGYSTIEKGYGAAEKAEYLHIINSVYTQLNKHNKDELCEALNRKNMDRWVWHGEGFTTLDCVFVEQHHLSLSPHIFTLPSEMRTFCEFFKKCGMMTACDNNRLVGVLEQINQARDMDKEKTRLYLQQTIEILNTIKDKMTSLGDEVQSQVLVPVANTTNTFKMMRIQDCCYCDEEWFRQDMQERMLISNVNLIHKDLPMDTAQKLGIPSVISKLLPTDNFGITEFGQGESLTLRLNKLLDEYNDGLAIFKEMIQNADDAEATEIRFIYDERQNSDHRERLLDPAMSGLQGPALWVYNNAEFTDEDFKNIIKLGGATKETDVDKIGKFGLGFNVVYNLTDVPSFVSSNFVVMFDPHTKYLGKALRKKTQPGIKIDMSGNNSMLHTLRDQFQPYQGLFGCEIGKDKSYDATLFRLPLRTKQQAEISDIKHLAYTNAEMMKLLQMCADNAQSLLLFTQHVKEMSVLHIPPDGDVGDMAEVCTVTKEEVLYVGDHHGQLSGQKSIMALAKTNSSSPDKLSCTAHVQITRKISPSSQLDIHFLQSDDISNWLIGSTAEMSQRQHKTIALGSVAMSLKEVDGCFIPQKLDSKKALVFCFLPLPIDSELNVHINGTFALSSNRQHLVERTIDVKESTKAEWNDALMKGVVHKAYVQCLDDVKDLLPSDVDADLYDVWPTTNVQKSIKPLVGMFYDESYKSTPFCAVEGETFNVHQVLFFDTENMPEDIADDAMNVFKELKDDYHIMLPPIAVLENLKSSGHTELVHGRLYNVTRFYRDIFFPNIEFIDRKDRTKLVLYAIQLNNKDVDCLLVNNACIATSGDVSTLRHISELVDPEGETARLYSKKEDDRFPSKAFRDPTVTDRLCYLGMQTDDITWDELVERTKTVQIEHRKNVKTALERMTLVLQFINKNLTTSKQSLEALDRTKQQLRSIKFLKCAKAPKDWPLRWRGDTDDSLYSPEELYDFSTSTLVAVNEPIAKDFSLPKVSEFLDFNKKPQMTSVKEQLKTLISMDITKISSRAYDICKDIVNWIYRFLQDNLDNENLDAEIVNLPCILINKGFVLPSKIAVDVEKDYPPYLYKLPNEFKRKYKKLIEAMGISEKIELGKLVQIMRQMSDNYNGKPLSDRDLKNATEIVSLISQRSEHRPFVDILTECGQIYVPNHKRVLHPSDSLCYNNCPWIEGEMNFVHQDMAYGQIGNLGIKTQQDQALHPHSIGIGFGQKQDLTTSINRLLRNCAKFEVLKEMIQNADDAGATEIHFIRDIGDYGKERLFNDSWKPLQGPALLVYNNKPFTEEDLEGIQRMGEGSKQHDPCTTGQYGVGFCSVYHLTDAPSVLTHSSESGKTLCAFDPQCLYVPGATKLEPGRRYNLTEQIQEQFSDVFQCYHEDKFDIENGCMFRLPLRTEQMAEESKISDGIITMEDIHGMLQQLENESSDILLFLNNIKKIKVSDMKSNGKIEMRYSIKVTMSEENSDIREQMANKCTQCFHKIKNGDLMDIDREHFVYTLTTEDNQGLKHEWCIAQTFGFDTDAVLQSELQEALDSGKLCLMPRGGVAFLKDKLSQCLPENDGKAFCFLPLHSDQTGLPVHINAHFALRHENRDSVWHTSGDYRSTWNELLCTTVISDAYCNLLEYMKRNLIEACANRKADEENLAQRFTYSLLPTLSVEHKNWNRLTKAAYNKIIENELCIFPVSVIIKDDKHIEWLPASGTGLDEVFFCTEYYEKPRNTTSQNDKKNETLTIIDIMKNCGMRIPLAPPKVGRLLQENEKNVSFFCPENVLRVLHSHNSDEPLCNISGLPLQINQTPIKNKDNLKTVLDFLKQVENFHQMLNNLPLLLTKDGIQRTFCTDEKILEPSFANLAEKESTNHFINKYIWYTVFHTINHDLMENSEHTVFKHLTVDKLADIIKEEYPNLVMNDDDKYIETSANQVTNKDKNMPSSDWIKLVWKFLHQSLISLLPEENRKNVEIPNVDMCIRLLAPIENLGLIPVTKGDQHFIFPIARAKHVFSPVYTEDEYRNINQCLVNLRVPCLDDAYIGRTDPRLGRETDISIIARSIVSRTDQPSAVLQLLHSALEEDQEVSPVWEEYSIKLLKHLQKHLDTLSADGKDGLLQDFPIFQTVSGDFVALSQFTARYTIPDDIPNEGLDYFHNTRDADTVFLKEISKLEQVYKHLGCHQNAVVDLYCDFVLPHFAQFEKEFQNIHLFYLYEKYLSNEDNEENRERERLTEALKELSIFESNGGKDRTAAELYDDKNEVFQLMLSDSGRFPPACPEQFDAIQWRHLLIKLGMVSKVNRELFIRFANEVSNDGDNTTTEEHFKVVLEKSQGLVRCMYNMETDKRDDLLPDIRDIPFLVRMKMRDHIQLQALFPQANFGNSPMMPFSGSIRSKHSLLGWTQLRILSSRYDPGQFIFDEQEVKNICRELQVHDTPPITHVLEHMSVLCTHIKSLSEPDIVEQRETIERVFDTIYEHLEKQEDLPDDLRDIPLVLIKESKGVCKANQIVCDMREVDEIRPFIFKIPLHLGRHADLFKKLGATDTVSHCQYLDILREIHDKVNGQLLMPNQILWVHRAVQGLFSVLSSETDVDLKRHTLYLPSESGCIADATHLVLNDAPSFYERLSGYVLPFMLDLRESGINIQSMHEIFKILPDEMHPQKLSQIVKERLNEASKADQRSTDLSREIEERIQSKEFADGCSRLMHCESRHKPDPLDMQQIQLIVEGLSVTYVRCVRHVTTELVHGDTVIPNSDQPKSISLEKQPGPQARWTIYITEHTDVDDILISLSDILNTILSKQLGNSILQLVPILQCPIGDIKDKLDRMNIHSHNIQRVQRPSLRPTIGANVHQEFLGNLKRDVTNYDVGEMVGYLPGQGLEVVYAKILSDEQHGKYTIQTYHGPKTVDAQAKLVKFSRD